MHDRRSFLAAILATGPAMALTAPGGRPALAGSTTAGSPSSRGRRRVARPVTPETQAPLPPHRNGSPTSRGPRRKAAQTGPAAGERATLRLTETDPSIVR